MTECMDREIQEMLPDVLHGTAGPAERARVDAHLAGCSSCREELATLRVVRGAAVFTPSIDVEAVVRRIPPYRIIAPVAERGVRSPVLKWLVAAGFALVAVGVGSVVMPRGEIGTEPTVVSVPTGHGFALASGLDGLSDGTLVQLMDEMSDFDALPASEPETVFAEDISTTTQQDSL